MKRRVLFRTDAGSGIGYGHFVRSLAVASMIRDDFDCVFVTRFPLPYLAGQLEGVARLEILPAGSEHWTAFLEMLSGDDIVFLDNYFFTSEYQLEVRRRCRALVVPDDLHDRYCHADVLINPYVCDPGVFHAGESARLCLGPGWAMLRPEFLAPVSRKDGRDVVVSFGGADPHGVMPRLLPLVRRIVPQDRTVNVIAGEYVQVPECPGVRVYRNVGAGTVASLFDSAAFAFLAASGICYEALSRRTPVVAGYHADNQKDLYAFVSMLPGTIPAGSLLTVDEDVLGQAFRKALETDGTSMLSFEGVPSRYVELFKSL